MSSHNRRTPFFTFFHRKGEQLPATLSELQLLAASAASCVAAIPLPCQLTSSIEPPSQQRDKLQEPQGCGKGSKFQEVTRIRYVFTDRAPCFCCFIWRETLFKICSKEKDVSYIHISHTLYLKHRDYDVFIYIYICIYNI